MTWESEHLERQNRLVIAIDNKHISESTAEWLDLLDNLMRADWINYKPTIIICSN